MMEDLVVLGILFDYYGELLNDKQKEYFKSYYFDDLSLQEISDNMSVSRNAVSKELKLIKIKLYFYEDKLHMYKKDEKLKQVINKIDDENIKKEIENIIKN